MVLISCADRYQLCIARSSDPGCDKCYTSCLVIPLIQFKKSNYTGAMSRIAIASWLQRIALAMHSLALPDPLRTGAYRLEAYNL